MPRLHQVVAAHKGDATRYFDELKALDKTINNKALFAGLAKNYTPNNPDDQDIPAVEQTRVQRRVPVVIREFRPRMVQHFDTVATLEWANQNARADVVVAGQTVLTQVPVNYLLFLEKKLTEIRGVLNTLPVLDPAYDWSGEPGDYRTTTMERVRTIEKKIPVVLIQPNEHTEGKAELVSQSIPVGKYSENRLSGAITEEERRRLVNRCEDLIAAVKVAREQANTAEVERQAVGETIFRQLFGE